MLDSELELAIREVKIAENQFNNADKDKINFAINKLMVAEENLNYILKKKKQEICKQNNKKQNEGKIIEFKK